MDNSYADRMMDSMLAAGMDRQMLADAIGVSVQTISHLANGKQASLNAVHNFIAAKALGVDAYWLATGRGSRGIFTGEQWPFDFDLADYLALPKADQEQIAEFAAFKISKSKDV